MYDCHLHTEFSYDCRMPIKAICEISLAHGMKGICLTDHVEIHPKNKEHEHLPDYPAYKASFEEAKASYGDRLEMSRGIELGLADDINEQNLAEIKKAEPDFIIGSVHYVDGQEIYTGEFSSGKTREEAYLYYLETVLRQVKTHDYFSVLGHLDMVLRDHSFENRSFDRAEFFLLVDDILKNLIESGRGIEVNSSGWGYGLGGPHPSARIIKRYKELGGTIITTGSDSHRFASVNKDIATATLLLKDLGFESVSYFHNLKEEKRKI